MKLTEEYPLPWKLERHDEHERGAWTITAANDREVMSCADFGGDGASISFNGNQAQEFCDIANMSGNKLP